MKKALLLMALFAGSLLSANAQTATADYLTAYVKPGTQKQLVVQLKNTGDYTAFQLKISLPTGISFADAAPVLSDRQDASHQLHFNKVDAQTMTIAAFSYKEEGTTKTGNQAFKNDKNVLLLVNVNVTDANYDASKIAISGVEFVNTGLEGKELALNAKGRLGDVDKNGELNTVDATYILKKYAGQTITIDYDVEAEDVDLDGEMNTVDATTVLKAYASE